MVSFPDWSRFAASTQSHRDDAAPRSHYERHREEEALRLAEQYGYFLLPTATLLAEKCSEPQRRKRSVLDTDTSADLSLVWLVRLESCRVRLLGDVGLCHNLTVCILGGNYLARFDALAECRNLFKLDLHSNQVGVPELKKSRNHE